MTCIGANARTVCEISEAKAEPSWMRELRLQGLDVYRNGAVPRWGADLSQLNLDHLDYYRQAKAPKTDQWQDLSKEIRTTYERLGVVAEPGDPYSGIQTQYDSEVVYGSMHQEVNQQEIIFTDTDNALREYPELVRKHFGTVVRPRDSHFAALNSAMWSGGVFVYLPAGTSVDLPLHGYYHVQAPHFGQFEHTIIVLEEGAKLNYIEACSSRQHPTPSLHAGVVEIILGPHASCRFSSVQDWAHPVFSLATRRAKLAEQATLQWISGNLGSRTTMSYPSVHLLGRGARADLLSVSVAGAGQHQDTGCQVLHAAPETSCKILSKSIAQGGGRNTFRGRVQVRRGSRRCKSYVCCDSLILDALSRCDAYPTIEVQERDTMVAHEASISKISTEQKFYLRSRGLTENEAEQTIVLGFLEPLLKELPMCYAMPLNRLIRMEMSHGIG